MYRIVIIGSGNVATHIALGLSGCCELLQVYSRNLEHAQRLAERAGIPLATSDLNDLVDDADIYLIAVSDDAIASIVEAIPDNGALWLHTSGTTPLSILKKHRKHCGILYPMQSFSRELAVLWDDVHIFVEANDTPSLNRVTDVANLLTPHVTPCDSKQRQVLHIAAVFSCNFANHMWAQAASLLESHGLSFDAMLPLIHNTAEKLNHLTPAQSQTGPAVRGDTKVIALHEAMLHGRQKEIYELLSASIHELEQRKQ